MDDIQNKPEEEKLSQARLFLEHLHKELQTIQSISEPALKLRMFALANDLISAKNYFKKLREGLKTKLMHDIDRDVDYEEWGNPKKWQVGIAKVIWRKTDDSYGYIPDKNELQDVSELLNDNNYKELERVTDSVKDVEEPNPKDVIIQENLEEKISTITNAVKNGVEVFGSDVYFPIELLRNAIAKGLNDLVGELNNIHILLEKNSWQPSVLVNMYESLEKRFVDNKAFGKNDIEKHYAKWKEVEDDNLTEKSLFILLANELKLLLSTNFIICYDDHYDPENAQNLKDEMNCKYVTYDDLDVAIKKYFFLMRLISYEKKKYIFTNRLLLGKYIFSNRKNISDSDILSFFRFKKMCELVYADLDAMKPKEKKKTGKAGRKKECIFKDESEENRKKRADEFMSFLKKHNKTGNNEINSAADNYINTAFYAFLEYWKDNEIVDISTNGRACYRFLTEDCKINASVDINTYNSAFSKFDIKDNFMENVALIDVAAFYKN